ncbi:uncharacterized protein [Amphiura filiformis]|uniref:uncharacterized protein n=1 Tax=Amphiura filiformis TaxID=82378 RepID=UPI003B226F4B
MAIAVRCLLSRPHALLLATATYSMVLSLIYMSYIYDWQMITYPNSQFQKGIHKWTYSSVSRSFFQEFKYSLGLGGDATTSRHGVRFDMVHEGYRDMTYQPLKLACSRCAIVSSSGHLLNTGAGSEIDAHPCIFRMNNAPTPGYEKDVGSLTTVRSMGHVNLIKSFEKNGRNRHEMFADNRTRTEMVLINWMNTVHVDVYSDQEYRYAILLAHLYPDVHFYAFTPEKMNRTQELFKNETGISSFEANTWLSTGWFTMVAAMDICNEITVYGMAHEDFCQNTTTYEENVPYHYYEPDKLKECQYYNKSETRLTGGHLFITEKAVFANWAVQHRKINFKHPTWPVKNSTNNLDTPFFNKFWAFIKEGGNMSELKKIKAPPKKSSRRRRGRRKKGNKVVIVTLQKGNESIKVNQDDLVDTLVELLPDVKLIQTHEIVDNGGDKNEKVNNGEEKKQNISNVKKRTNLIQMESSKKLTSRHTMRDVNNKRGDNYYEKGLTLRHMMRDVNNKRGDHEKGLTLRHIIGDDEVNNMRGDNYPEKGQVNDVLDEKMQVNIENEKLRNRDGNDEAHNNDIDAKKRHDKVNWKKQGNHDVYMRKVLHEILNNDVASEKRGA